MTDEPKFHTGGIVPRVVRDPECPPGQAFLIQPDVWRPFVNYRLEDFVNVDPPRKVAATISISSEALRDVPMLADLMAERMRTALRRMTHPWEFPDKGASFDVVLFPRWDALVAWWYSLRPRLARRLWDKAVALDPSLIDDW